MLWAAGWRNARLPSPISKYNAQFHAKAQAEVARGQHFNSAEEYRKYLALLSEGRDTLFDPDVSVPLADCPFVQDLSAIR